MKKFIIIVLTVIVLYISWDIAYYRLGWYIDLHPDAPVTTFTKTQGDQLYVDTGNGYEQYIVKGVNMGSGIPGEWSTDFAADEETYLRWFAQIQEMGANTLRIYTVQAEDFYNAFYAYNKDNPNPLWLIQGVWVNDYIQNSHRDAYDNDFYGAFLDNCKTMVDVVHGKKKITLGRMASAGSGTYNHDISQWVIGYILGVEWEDVTVAYTDEKYKDNEWYNQYTGEYMYTTEDATPFEAMLAQVGDKVIEYESTRYKQQRLVAFANWMTTDPLDYPEDVVKFFEKCAKVDVEHIKTTENLLSGQFASYHVYPYHPDYLNYVSDWGFFGITDLSPYYAESGSLNTYRLYLTLLNEHHTMPVVISEFGVSTGRGMAQKDQNTGRNQGNMSETEQGQALIECYEDIMAAGSAGGCVFSWQDEWFKRTWNTMYAVDLTRTPYWSDYQTNEQYFGLLSFDPGEEKSVCYVDGDVSEWEDADIVTENRDMTLSMKYDEKFLYFLVKKDGLDFEGDTLYLSFDTTPKSGSTYCENYDLLFDRAVDFVLILNGADNSRLQVQERYEALRSTYSQNVYAFDTYVKGNIPDVDSPLFVDINLVLRLTVLDLLQNADTPSETFGTGKLTYGNANPECEGYNSLADFCASGDYIEIKLPWQLLNFYDPSRMYIHDDYYDGNYGIESIQIREMYLGITDGADVGRCELSAVRLKGWDNKVTYHERLKPSYYILQAYWKGESNG